MLYSVAADLVLLNVGFSFQKDPQFPKVDPPRCQSIGRLAYDAPFCHRAGLTKKEKTSETRQCFRGEARRGRRTEEQSPSSPCGDEERSPPSFCGRGAAQALPLVFLSRGGGGIGEEEADLSAQSASAVRLDTQQVTSQAAEVSPDARRPRDPLKRTSEGTDSRLSFSSPTDPLPLPGRMKLHISVRGTDTCSTLVLLLLCPNARCAFRDSSSPLWSSPPFFFSGIPDSFPPPPFSSSPSLISPRGKGIRGNSRRRR
mmetsp:Transcript_3099/g.6344  ORF Transcript_3099/g.6344 Transcript_3099/m.6344 type:complete len:257 (-) Transcript_3099:155-925(-)